MNLQIGIENRKGIKSVVKGKLTIWIVPYPSYSFFMKGGNGGSN